LYCNYTRANCYKSGEWVGGDVASGSPGGVTPEFGEGDGGDDCGVGGEVGLSPG